MTFSLRISRSGLALIKSFEGFRERATRLPDGRWVVGYGHVKSAREGVRVSPEDAEALLIYDLKPIEEALEDLLFSPLNQNQHDAIVSFASNISLGLFRDSEVLRFLNSGEHIRAAHAMEVWRKARLNGHVCVVDALVRRRAIEKALFLEHPDGRATAATPLVAPQKDVSVYDVQKEPEIETQSDDIENMTSALEQLLATGSPIPEASNPSVDLKENLEPDFNFNGESDFSEGVIPANKVTNTDQFDTSNLDDQEVVFIGETDEEVFHAIGVEVDDALQQAERKFAEEASVEQDAGNEDGNINSLEEEKTELTSIAMAVNKVERLIANDDLALDDTFEDGSSTQEIGRKSDSFVANKMEAANDIELLETEEKVETPEQVISSLLGEQAAREEAHAAKLSSKATTPKEAADAVAARLANIFQPEIQALSEEINDKPVELDRDASTNQEPEQNAWNLSETLTRDSSEQELPLTRSVEDEVKKTTDNGYGYADTALQPEVDIRDEIGNETSLTDELSYDVGSVGEYSENKAGKRLWLSALIASIAVIIFGIVDFYKKAQPGQIVKQSDIAYGPLMIAIGGVIFLMAAYFLVSRRGVEKDAE